MTQEKEILYALTPPLKLRLSWAENEPPLPTGEITLNLTLSSPDWERDLLDLTRQQAKLLAEAILELLDEKDIELPEPTRFVHRIGDSQDFSK